MLQNMEDQLNKRKKLIENNKDNKYNDSQLAAIFMQQLTAR